MKKKHCILVITPLALFLLWGCNCGWSLSDLKVIGKKPLSIRKFFHIVNHTDKTYTDNALYLLGFRKTKTSQWHLAYRSTNIVEERGNDYSHTLKKIKFIKPRETIHTLEKEADLWKVSPSGCDDNYTYYSASKIVFDKYKYKAEPGDSNEEARIFLLSLNSGKRKMFFGLYTYLGKMVKEKIGCETYEFIKWNMHPVFRQDHTYIYIYEDRMEVGLDKVSQVKLEGTQVDITKIPIVDLNCP